MRLLPLILAMAALAPATGALTATIRYNVPTDSRVSVVIENSKGEPVRSLLAAQDRERGNHTEEWDGRDDSGRDLPAGTYRYRVLAHAPITARPAATFAGGAEGQAPGGFLGDDEPPIALASSGNLVALATSRATRGDVLVGCDLSGKKLWGVAPDRFAGQVIRSLAASGATLWVAVAGSGSGLRRFDLATGKEISWGQDGGRVAMVSPSAGDRAEPAVSAIAASGSRVAVALYAQNSLAILDGLTGAVLSTLPVMRPASVCALPDGGWCVLSQGRVLRIDGAETASPVGEGRYADATSLACGPDGRLYLAMAGASQDVWVLSPAGKRLREIGQAGGRPAFGAYDADGMRRPAQMAVDVAGKLWVAEETTNPRRLSVWNCKNGKLEFERVCGTRWGMGGAVCPSDPTMAIADDTVYRLDWKTGASEPRFCLGSRDLADEIFPARVGGSPIWFARRGGDTLVYSSLPDWIGLRCTLLRDGRWRAVAALGVVPDPAQLPAGSEGRRLAELSCFAGHVGEVFLWADRNGDSRLHLSELKFTKLPPGSAHYPLQVRPGPDGDVALLIDGGRTVMVLHAFEVSATGAPLYEVVRPRSVRLDEEARPDGVHYVTMGGQDTIYLVGTQIRAVDIRGKSRWSVAEGGPWRLIGVVNVDGPIGEAVLVVGRDGVLTLFSRDGVMVDRLSSYVGAVAGKPGTKRSSESAGAGGPLADCPGATIVRTDDGRIMLGIGETDARVVIIEGLETARLSDGKVALRSDAGKEARSKR